MTAVVTAMQMTATTSTTTTPQNTPSVGLEASCGAVDVLVLVLEVGWTVEAGWTVGDVREVICEAGWGMGDVRVRTVLEAGWTVGGVREVICAGGVEVTD